MEIKILLLPYYINDRKSLPKSFLSLYAKQSYAMRSFGKSDFEDYFHLPATTLLTVGLLLNYFCPFSLPADQLYFLSDEHLRKLGLGNAG